MKRLFTLFLALLFIAASATSYANKNDGLISAVPSFPNDSLLKKITDIDKRLKQYTEKDTLGGYSTPRKIETASYFKQRKAKNEPQRDREGLIVLPFEYEPFLSYINFIDTVIVSPVMLPVVFDGKLLPKEIDFRDSIFTLNKTFDISLIKGDSIVSPELYKYNSKNANSYKLLNKDSTLYSKLWNMGRTKSIRQHYYLTHPERIKSNALQYDAPAIIKREVESRNPFKELISTGGAIEIAKPDIEKRKVKQVFWKTWGEHKLEFSQKAYSENWNPKTNNSFHIQNYHKFNAKYRKNKIEFNHWIEWRLNVQSVSLPKEEKEKNENYNSLLINDDWVRTYNRLGLDAFIKRWSYIFNIDIKTPILNKYPQNDKERRLAGIFSPLDVNFGIGASYNYEWKSKTVKDRNFRISIDATPLSFDLRHVGSREVYKNNDHGVKYENDHRKAGEPRYTKTELGSTYNATIDYKLNSYASLFSRTRYFTNYERVYLECENTLRFKLNQYLATSLYVYMKFDDSVGRERRDDTWGYFSFNEVLGFGLSYNWQ